MTRVVTRHHARHLPVRGTGARPECRRLCLEEVEQRQALWRSQPPSPERAKALKTIRVQLKSIRNRVGETL